MRIPDAKRASGTDLPHFHALTGRLRDLPVVAADLGYSSNRRTCGVATSDRPEGISCMFGEAIPKVARFCADRTNPVLVLEAVLSTRHCSSGNPCIRGAFERGRGWYWGPGAVTMIAALRFLSELERMLPKVVGFGLPRRSYRTSPSAHATKVTPSSWRHASGRPSPSRCLIIPNRYHPAFMVFHRSDRSLTGADKYARSTERAILQSSNS
jgi:hypothetical protein